MTPVTHDPVRAGGLLRDPLQAGLPGPSQVYRRGRTWPKAKLSCSPARLSGFVSPPRGIGFFLPEALSANSKSIFPSAWNIHDADAVTGSSLAASSRMP